MPAHARRLDVWPLVVLAALMLLALPLLPSTSTWITLTVAGLAMGAMIFMMASGLTIVFGLMDVMNFAHGAFIATGAYLAASVFFVVGPLLAADDLGLNLLALGLACLAACLVTGCVGYVFERIVLRPVYGRHLQQILVTMGGLIVCEQLVIAIWGPQVISLPRPRVLTGSIVFLDATVERYRLVALAVGCAVFAAVWLLLNRTRIGLVVRAGVENGEMVQALGYRIRRVFIAVFVAGSALAGLGGAMWAVYQEAITPAMGTQVLIFVFIVVIIGGLGSIGGCFVGAMLVGLIANYTGYVAPKLALGSNLLLMVMILLWRPNGLYAVKS
jgi:branched-chain amino acid transport system permease protein